MENLEVHSSQRKYNVFFNTSSFLTEKTSDFYFVDSNIYSSWKELWIDKKVFVLSGGEKEKELDTYIKCIEWLELEKAHRGSRITVVGGGTILDSVGFVASTYLRGIEWNAIPTTLLSMVDSCIGGKVGLNFRGDKNRIGQFYPPTSVWINDQWLKTLPKRDFQNGYAEIIKTAALINSLFWQECLNISLIDCIKKCLEYKADIIKKDEFEKDDKEGRFVLNAGHTVAHGLESLYPDRYLHGEAVSIGLIIETAFGVQMGYCDPFFLKDLIQKLSKMSLPLEIPNDLNINRFIDILLKDKKGDGINLSLSMIIHPGKCKLVSSISPYLFKKFLKEKIGADKI